MSKVWPGLRGGGGLFAASLLVALVAAHAMVAAGNAAGERLVLALYYPWYGMGYLVGPCAVGPAEGAV